MSTQPSPGDTPELVLAYDRQEDVLALLTEYTDSILQHGEEVRQCLQSQHLEEELIDLQTKYALPHGRLYLALVQGVPAGCVALTPNDDKFCEIKRLYLRPAFRGHHLEELLTQRVIQDAKAIGYRHMRLDTFPFMVEAIGLYQRLGFTFIPRYNDNPAENALFMQLDL
ncbi:MAG: GNAT family N-acetyltransferase [Evtepia sp.]|uniref:GNAT family N-acetyltransferase n=1 Tax=Evtepia sp. TaxID=2773933 RepID=UPI002A7546A9|nr:GNAT family N-acetyltransferase [Evtepia sp.]MDY3015192.1 GNAT family N-acetyltransferase [Evtepia sp.]